MKARGLRRDPAGYAIVLAAYLLMAATAPLVAFTHAPTGVVLTLRMGIAADGQSPSLWTVAGGALVIGAGILVILFGGAEGETSVAELAEAELV